MFGRAQPLVTCLAAVLVARGGPALAQLEGSYKTRGQQVSVQVKTWGENCGSRPRSYSSGSGKVVEVRRAGAHLSIGSQRTDACWSRNPKVQRQRATAGPRRAPMIGQKEDGDWRVANRYQSDGERSSPFHQLRAARSPASARSAWHGRFLEPHRLR